MRALLDRRPQPAVPALAHDARRSAPRTPSYDFRPFIIADADTGHGGDAARAQPDPPLRRGRRARLPHRGPAARHQEVRPPGRQGAGAGGRADQAAQRGALPARRHEGAGHHRGPHRRRGGHPARQPRRRARPAVHPRRHQRGAARLQDLLPGHAAALPRAGRRPSSTATCSTALPTRSTPPPTPGCERVGLSSAIDAEAAGCLGRRRAAAGPGPRSGARPGFVDAWEGEAGLKTYGEAVAEVIALRSVEEGDRVRPDRWRSGRPSPAPRPVRRIREKAGDLGHRHVIWDCRAGPHPRGLLPGPRRHRLRHRQVAGRGALRRHPVDGDQDRQPGGGARTSPRPSTPSTPTRCWPTTCRRRSTGTPPA